MPAIGNIALADAKGTPVVHTFAPVTTDGNEGKLANRAASIPKGFETLSLVVSPATTATGAIRVSGKFTFPTVGVVDSQDTVIRESKAEFVIHFSQLSSVQDRKDYAKILSNLFNHATFVSMVENLEPLY